MLRSARYLKSSFEKSISLCGSSFQGRQFTYQKEIYTNDFEQVNHKIPKDVLDSRAANPNLYRFINAYHKYGYKLARLDPLELTNLEDKMGELDPKNFGLDEAKFNVDNLLHSAAGQQLGLSEVESYLKQAYSSNWAIEFEHLQSEEEKLWLAKEFEQINAKKIDNAVKLDLVKLLLKSQIFDLFLASKFPTFKRYSLEGGESSLAFYYSTFLNLTNFDIENLIMGIAHRGRLNLSVLMLDLDPRLLFTKIKGRSEFTPEVTATGDIAHHFPCSTDLTYGSKKIHVSLLPNPSHLEAVDPLVLGKARSKQMLKKDGFYADSPSSRSNKVASLLIHGDGAFAGQGIVTETFQLSRIPNYGVGGSLHLIINNQLGFTLPSLLGRSSQFNSDLAKAVDCPIVHVNGDHPEVAFKAGELAAKYRQRYGKDIVVDLICFRKHGHNELDDPTFTNPIMYKKIQARSTVPNRYEKEVMAELGSEKASIDQDLSKFRTFLEQSFDQVNNSTYKIEPRNTYLSGQWSSLRPASNKERTYWNTGFNLPLLQEIGLKSVKYPEGFSIHPTVERAHVKRRIERINESIKNPAAKNIDWSTAETLAIGSLLLQGFNVRISGQDVGRGTFSNRHAILVDQSNAQVHIPLNELVPEQKNFFEVCNSLLSEEAVLGYEYAFALDHPNNLVIWEAQFGDFFNGAQIIIDTFVSSGEVKWMHQCGLVMLLPHGFDGAGPEHSSCRIERFLQSSTSSEDRVDSDDINYYVCHPTTPANYFHLLRRQMITPFRKPLIVASPKMLIRLPECVSSLNELSETNGSRFQPVIDDSKLRASKDSVKRVIFVFGKHYYALEEERSKRGAAAENVAIVRIEEISPFPASELRDVLKSYKNAKEFVWAQEEHRNMGAWFFVEPRFERILGVKLEYAGRDNKCAVVGIGALHAAEVKHVLSKPFDKF